MRDAKPSSIWKLDQITAFLENSNMPVFAVDMFNYSILYGNRGFTKYWGEVTGQLCFKVIHNFNSPCSKCGKIRIDRRDQSRLRTCRDPKNPNRKFRFHFMDFEADGERVVRYIIAENLSEPNGKQYDNKSISNELDIIKKELIEKTIAFDQVLDSIDRRKKKVIEEIEEYLGKVVKPLVEMIKDDERIPKSSLLELLFSCFDNITSLNTNSARLLYSKLTIRELKICTMLKNGLDTKQIANLLNTSFQTVRKQRTIIRKKLNLTGKKINLAAYLIELEHKEISPNA
ncbi:MAG: LuxR C-terminal-related transcriptional regulator [candidate division Zixibacteria bacterium]